MVEQNEEEKFIQNYLLFKELCVDSKIISITEIIKLYGLFLTLKN